MRQTTQNKNFKKKEKTMTKNIEKKHTWKTATGLKVTATCELTLTKTHNIGGNKIETPCCEKDFDIRIEKMGAIGNHISREKTVVDGFTYPAAWGKLAISEENLAAIDKMIAEVEAHPSWVAKQAQIEKNRKEIEAMEKTRKSNGYCSNLSRAALVSAASSSRSVCCTSFKASSIAL